MRTLVSELPVRPRARGGEAEGVADDTFQCGASAQARAETAPDRGQLIREEPICAPRSADTDFRCVRAPSQRAMAVAMIYPEPEKGGRGKKGAGSGTFSDVSHQRLSDARAVLAASSAKAADVLAGTLALDKAYSDVKQDVEDSKRLQWDRERRRSTDGWRVSCRCKCGLPEVVFASRGQLQLEAWPPAYMGR